PGARGGGFLCDQFAPRPLENQANFPWCDSQNPSSGVEWPFYYGYHPADTRRAATWLLGYTKRNGVAVTWDSTATEVNNYDSSVPKVALSLTDRDRFYPIPQAAIDSNLC
ncbi:MAG TPA: hypothetical protein VFQ76_12005, partial [Longimicrobiaceae bacterium]|nr:hypothetical protein [Longimicrobiaceae bacterium]